LAETAGEVMEKYSEKHSFLVVDDEPNVLDSIYDLFRRDYRVLRASNAATAKQLLKQEPVHIVMTDQRMPEVTGVELLEQIKREHPDTVRLIFTGYADIQVVVRAINEGQVFRYLTKPWDPDELRGVVRQAAEYYDLVQERKQLIAELQKANQELRQANALKTAFLDVASHELNTPITIVLAMSELAEERLVQSGGDAVINHVHVIRSGAARLEHLVQNMIKLLQAGSFQTVAERQTVKCRQVLDKVAEQVGPFLDRRRQRLELQVQPPDAVITVDRGKIHDVVLNLVINAIKFSPDGSTIELHAVVRADQSLAIEVVDSGVGIAACDLPHIFDPLFTSFNTLQHSSGSYEFCKRGLGMGLAIVRKFVEMHGGTIRVEPRDPRGTRFIIELPMIPHSQLPAPNDVAV
jgi:signal transduction histidine kinase